MSAVMEHIKRFEWGVFEIRKIARETRDSLNTELVEKQINAVLTDVVAKDRSEIERLSELLELRNKEIAQLKKNGAAKKQGATP